MQRRRERAGITPSCCSQNKLSVKAPGLGPWPAAVFSKAVVEAEEVAAVRSWLVAAAAAGWPATGRSGRMSERNLSWRSSTESGWKSS